MNANKKANNKAKERKKERKKDIELHCSWDLPIGSNDVSRAASNADPVDFATPPRLNPNLVDLWEVKNKDEFNVKIAIR